MKTSILTLIVFFVTLTTLAQQNAPHQEGSISQIIDGNDSKSIDSSANNITVFSKTAQDEVTAISDHLATQFDQVQLNNQCSNSTVDLTEGKLMTSIRETFSYSRKLMFNNKKYEIISGMTGKGVGVKLRL